MVKKQNASKEVKNEVQVKNDVQAKSSNVITVMSKLPFDLAFNNAKGEKKIIRGMKQDRLVMSKGSLGFYAITVLDKDDWDFFCTVNKETKYLANKIILAQENAADARAEAREHQFEKTGFEQKNPKEVAGIQKSTSEEANSNDIVIG